MSLKIGTSYIAFLLENIESITLQAGRLAREKWGRPLKLSSKGFRDIVTDADIAVQKFITEAIRNQFPDHGFLTEETDENLPDDGSIIWVIDPIDGTTNYSRRIPVYCVTIAAMVKGEKGQAPEILVGATYDPMRDELFSAAIGNGCHLNHQTIHVSEVNNIEEAVIGMDWSHSPQLRKNAIGSLNRFGHHNYTIRAIGSSALALAWIACGRLDGYLNHSLYLWDVAAGSLLIKEAGGLMTGMNGQPWKKSDHRGACVASNGRIHQEFLELIT